jgi:2-methylisocitrate lyase-like PEP mutase family enzyme
VVTRERIELFRSYHRAPSPLLLPNAWDVGSAVAISQVPRCRAIATTSAGVAWARGYPDGERIPRDEMLEEVRRIAAAVDVPVTADLEAGYGDPAETARLALEAGAVGMNLEDELRPLDESVERVRAALSTGIVVNARTDAFLRGGSIEEAIERLNAYLDAGADCAFAAGVRDADAIERLAREVHGPLSVFAGPGWPTVTELRRLGVARISLAAAVARAAYSLAAAVAEEVFGEGTYERLQPAAPLPSLNGLLQSKPDAAASTVASEERHR